MKKETKDFYLLYPNLLDCTLQYFDDTKRGKSAGILENTTDNFVKLKALNEEGRGIFFSINSMEKGKRKQECVTNINAWACEIDNKSKEEQLLLIADAPIEPSCIVESKKSYHLYWFAKDGTKANWRAIGMGLRNYFDGDVAVAKDVSRVLRLPGFYHCKDPEDKFFVECVYVNETSYTEKQMMEAYPYKEPVFEGVSKKAIDDGDGFWYVLNSRDCVDLLTRLSGTYLVNGEKISFKKHSSGDHQIRCNEKSTGAWIDKDGKIGSHDKGGPSRINRLQRYGKVGASEIAEWAKSNCKDLLPERFLNYKKYKAIAPSSGCPMSFKDMGYKAYSTGSKKIDETIGHIRSHELVMIHGKSKNGKTSYTTALANNNGIAGNRVAFFSLEMEKEKLKTQQSAIRSGIDRAMFETGNYTEYQRELYSKIYTNFDKQFTIFDINSITEAERSQGYTLTRLVYDIRSLYLKGYEVFIIDSLGLISGEGRMSKNEWQGEIVKQFMALKNELPIAIILIHHNNKGGITYSGSQDLENFVDWRFEIEKNIDPDADGVNIFHQTIVRVYKERLGKELEFIFNYDRGELVYESHGYISLDNKTSQGA